VVYKVNPKMHIHQYENYVEGQEEEDGIDVYQEELVEHQNFMVYDRPRLTEFATRDIELMEEEEQNPPKKRLRKSQRIIHRKQTRK
jgi:hypothetical protein